MTFTALLLIFLVFAAFGLISLAVVMVLVLRKSAATKAEEAIKPLVTKVTGLMERMEGLEARYERAMGLGASQAPAPAGRTKALADRARQNLDAVEDDWMALQRVLEAARERSSGGPADLAGTGYAEAAEIAKAEDAEARFERASAKAGEAAAVLDELEGAPLRAAEVLGRAEAFYAALANAGKADAETSAVGARLAALDADKPWADPVAIAGELEQALGVLERQASAAGVAVPGAAAATGASGASGALLPGARVPASGAADASASARRADAERSSR